MKRTALFMTLAMLATSAALAAAPKQIKVKPIGNTIEVRDFAAAYARLCAKDKSAPSYLSDALSFAQTGKYLFTAEPYDPDVNYIDHFSYTPPYSLDMGSSDVDGHEIVHFRGWAMDNGHTLFGVQEMAGQDCNTYIKFFDYDPATRTFTLVETHTRFLEQRYGHDDGITDEHGKPIVCLHRIDLCEDGLHLYDKEDFMNTGSYTLLPWDGKGFIVSEVNSSR